MIQRYRGYWNIPLHEGRRIFIFRQGTEAMEQARQIVEAQLCSGAAKIGLAVRLFPFLRRKMQFFANRISATAEKGIPALAEQALSHVMENMWLTATAHGVGFQLLSVTNGLAKNAHFMELLGLPLKK